MISKAKVKKYLRNPFACPFCGSDEISAGEKEAVNSEMTQIVHCDNQKCRKSWKEIYRIAGIEETE